MSIHRVTLSLLLIAVTTTHGFPKTHHKSGDEGGSAAGNSLEVVGSSDTAADASTTQDKPERSSYNNFNEDPTHPKTENSEATVVSSVNDDEPPPPGELVGPLPPPPTDEKKSCMGITCDPPPVVPGGQCHVSSQQEQVNPIIPIVGSNADCCPVHVCTRPDGSTFTHYGIQTDSSNFIASSATGSGGSGSIGGSISTFSSSGDAPPPYLMGPPPGFFPPQGPSQIPFRYYQQQQNQMRQFPPPGFFPQGGPFGPPFNRPLPPQFQMPPPFPLPPPPFNFLHFYAMPNNGPIGGLPPGTPFIIEQRGGPNSQVNRIPFQPSGGGATSYGERVPQGYQTWETTSGNARDRRLATESQQFGGGILQLRS